MLKVYIFFTFEDMHRDTAYGMYVYHNISHTKTLIIPIPTRNTLTDHSASKCLGSNFAHNISYCA